ncbi:HAD family acid phosphatase [Actinopolyspora halophila]|uniref:HAD family acid phosphatase n=1 Tax=Actinopolyspora halophila TaxID=1850 RepID=UPI0006888BB0|nr:HAD family acid phosphatase [Actinopolyspora halophila]
MSRQPLLTLSRTRRALTASATVVALTGIALFSAGAGIAENSTPRTARNIPNLDQVKTEIAAYYGDIETEDGEHYASPESNYAEQVRRVEDQVRKSLNQAAVRADEGKPAIVVDVDDTTLLMYNFERRIGYDFTGRAQDEYLRSTDADPVFGMPDLVNRAHDENIAVFFVTGREEYQRDWSVRNLKNAGYDVPVGRKHFFLENTDNPPPYLECGSECTTVEYKSGTRKHIESRGYDILANVGDQYSDLKGGYADKTFKLPNPMYRTP